MWLLWCGDYQGGADFCGLYQSEMEARTALEQEKKETWKRDVRFYVSFVEVKAI